MYKIITIRDKVSVNPSKFGMSLEDAVKSSLEEKWEGTMNKKLGVILSVVSIGEIGEGSILPGNGSIYYPLEFKLLTYIPEMHELVKGEVIDVTEFGVFIRIGPLDGMVHVSQIMDDFVSYDPKNLIFTGRDSKRIMKEKDAVRARVISVSMGPREYKIGLTTRQPGLGSLSWYEKGAAKPKPKVKTEKKEVKKPKKK